MDVLGTPKRRRPQPEQLQVPQKGVAASAAVHSSHNESAPDLEAGQGASSTRGPTPAPQPSTEPRARPSSLLPRWVSSILSSYYKLKGSKKDKKWRSSEYDLKFHMKGFTSATNTVGVVAGLIATLSFTALLQPPGGIDLEGGIDQSGRPRSIGRANLASTPGFKIFFVANGMALFVALLAILTLTSIVPRSHYSAFLLYEQGKILVWVATIFTIAAFTSAAAIVAGPDQQFVAYLLLGVAVFVVVLLIAIIFAVKIERKILRPRREAKKRLFPRSRPAYTRHQ